MKTSDLTIVATTYGRLGYKWHKTAEIQLPPYSGSGCSATFYKMGAEPNTDDLALKVFGDADECLASYQRQALAFKEGVAPPVGRLILVTQVSSWNNQPYESYALETGVCSDLDTGLRLEISARDRDDQGKHPFVKALRRRLRRVNLTGTILNDVFRCTICDILVPSGSGICLGGDLHSKNYMMWHGAPVCIDFGHHAVLTSRRGRPAPLCDFSCTRALGAKRVARELGIRA
jgi:hypothetical protein